MNDKKRVAYKAHNYRAGGASVRIRCLNILRQLRAERYPVEIYRKRHQPAYRTVLFSKAYTPKDVKDKQLAAKYMGNFR